MARNEEASEASQVEGLSVSGPADICIHGYIRNEDSTSEEMAGWLAKLRIQAMLSAPKGSGKRKGWVVFVAGAGNKVGCPGSSMQYSSSRVSLA